MEQQKNPLTEYEQMLKSEFAEGFELAKKLEQMLNNCPPDQGVMSRTFISALTRDASSVIKAFANIVNRLSNAEELLGSSSSSSAPPLVASSPILIRLPSPNTNNSSSSQAPTPEGSPSNSIILPLPTNFETADSPVLDDLLNSLDPRSTLTRKRKCLPRKELKLPASTNQHGNDSPTDDGYTWRKYGEKDILNSRHRRSYYRCTYSKEFGCLATKHVQKCEDDDSFYKVTYTGDHTCQVNRAQWPRTSFLPRISTDQHFQTTSTGTSLTINTVAGIYSSRLDDLKAERLLLSPRTTSFGSSTITAPIIATPKFGSETPSQSTCRPSTEEHEEKKGDSAMAVLHSNFEDWELTELPTAILPNLKEGNEGNEIETTPHSQETTPKTCYDDDLGHIYSMEYDTTFNNDSMLFDS